MRISDWSSDVCSSDLCAHQPAQKLLVRGAQSLWQLAPQPGTSVEQYLQGAVHFGHADKGPLVLAGDVLVVAEQYFVGRLVVDRQIDHEELDPAVADVARFEELPHVEKVEGVLPILSGHQPVGVPLVRCQYRARRITRMNCSH